MYPERRVDEYIRDNFVPVKIHVKEQPAQFERFGAQWTPTIVVLDPNATERHRFEGYLPADDFLAQLRLGKAKAAFAHSDWQQAQGEFRDIVEKLPEADAAAEALYWAGVAEYKRTGEASALAKTADQFKKKYQQSAWAKKASVWAA